MLDISSEKYSGSTKHRNWCYQWINLQWRCRRWATNSQPQDYKSSALAIELYNSKAMAGKELSLSCLCTASLYFSFLNCDWLPIQEEQWLYWTQRLLVPVERFTVRIPNLRFELTTPGLQTQCSGHRAIQLNSYCWEGVEFIPMMYCIIIYLSFLNCVWLPIREVLWFYWTQKLLVLAEKLTVRMPTVSLQLETLGLQTQCSSHWAIQLKSSCLGKSWVYPVGVLHHYIFVISQLWFTFHPRSTVVLLDKETPGTSREIYSEDEEGEDRTRNPWITNTVLLPLSYTAQKLSLGRNWVYPVGVLHISVVFNCDGLFIWELQLFSWKQKLLVPIEKLTVRMPKVRLELTTPGLQTPCYSHWPTPGLQTPCCSHWAIQLKSYSWEGVEFIQLVYCIIIYLSFLNCDWLLIREVQWFYWTKKLLVPVEKFTVRMKKVRIELATPGLQTQCSCHWAIQLKSYRWEGIEFIQLVYCIYV